MKKSVVILAKEFGVGGAQFVTYQIAKVLHDAKITVRVIAADKGETYDRVESEGIEIYHFPQWEKDPFGRELEKYIEGFDIVLNSNFLFLVETLVFLKIKMNFELYMIFHAGIDYVMQRVLPFHRGIDRFVLTEKLKVILISKGVPANKINTMKNFIDTDLLTIKTPRITERLKKEYNIPVDATVIGMLTRIAGDKNLQDAIRIFESVCEISNQYYFILIGSALKIPWVQIYRSKVMNQIERSPYKNRIIVLENETVEKIYATLPIMDIMINTSPSEGLPISLLEGMGAGVYCVFPSFTEIPSILYSRGSVILIRQRILSSELFGDNVYTEQEKQLFVDEIMSLDKNKMNKTCNLAKDYIVKNYSVKAQKETILKYFS